MGGETIPQIIAFSPSEDRSKNNKDENHADTNDLERPGSQVIGRYDPATDIIVHVIDQNRGISRDFSCSKDKVMAKMRYFQSYFN